MQRWGLSAPSGVGRVRLYADAARTTAVPLPKTWQAADLAGDPVTLYVQGILVSNTSRDVRLSLNYTGPEETCVDTIRLTVFKVTLSADPSSIPALSSWTPILPAAATELPVTWEPADLEGTLEIVEVVGDQGYVPPDMGALQQREPAKWLYIAFFEPQTELCPRPANVRIAAKVGDLEGDRVSVRVLPIHTWWTTPHNHGPGGQEHPPDTADYNNVFDYLSWKYAGVLGTTGCLFTDVTMSLDPQVICGITAGYACTTGTAVEFGTSAFAGSENQAASIIGHERVHAALGWLAGECPAYRWEADHCIGTGVCPCDAGPDQYLANVLAYLIDHNCP